MSMSRLTTEEKEDDEQEQEEDDEEEEEQQQWKNSKREGKGLVGAVTLYHSGPFRSDSLRDGMEHRESVLGTERYHDLISVYQYRFIPVISIPIRSDSVRLIIFY
uniref:Uncharacterized protein n=1 Tax=Solanum tuberosum TaxID=4113 RepID=M1C425_SOLTU